MALLAGLEPASLLATSFSVSPIKLTKLNAQNISNITFFLPPEPSPWRWCHVGIVDFKSKGITLKMLKY